MVEKAHGRGSHDKLKVTELSEFMATHPMACDIIFSADTLIYFGDLEPPLCAAATALSSGGVFAFAVEQLTDRRCWGFSPESQRRLRSRPVLFGTHSANSRINHAIH